MANSPGLAKDFGLQVRAPTPCMHICVYPCPYAHLPTHAYTHTASCHRKQVEPAAVRVKGRFLPGPKVTVRGSNGREQTEQVRHQVSACLSRLVLYGRVWGMVSTRLSVTSFRE